MRDAGAETLRRLSFDSSVCEYAARIAQITSTRAPPSCAKNPFPTSNYGHGQILS